MRLLVTLWLPLLLAALKTAGALHLSWVWVTAPCWLYAGVIVLVTVAFYVDEWFDDRDRRTARRRCGQ